MENDRVFLANARSKSADSVTFKHPGGSESEMKYTS